MCVEYVAHQYLSHSIEIPLFVASVQIVYLSMMNALSATVAVCVHMQECEYVSLGACYIVFMLQGKKSVRVKEKWTMAIVASFIANSLTQWHIPT